MKKDDSASTLLRGLLLPDATARRHLDEWSRDRDLNATDSKTHPLLPALYKRLVELDMSISEIDRLRGVYRKTWYRNQRHLAALKRAIEVLVHGHVEATLVGGFALAIGAYDDLGLRMVDAAEVVVSPRNRDRSIDLLNRAGFKVEGPAHRTGFGLPARLSHQNGGQIDIREFVYGPGWSGAPEEQLWKRRETTEFDGMPLRVLAPSDAFAATAAFALSLYLPTHQWPVDLTMLSRQMDPAVAWPELVHHYRDTMLSVPISEAVEYLAAEISEELVPESSALIRSLGGTRKHRLQFWFHRRGRRLARLPAWYLRAMKSADDSRSAGFTSFAKGVYGVDSARDAVVKARRRFHRG